jgi:hypothetical protein
MGRFSIVDPNDFGYQYNGGMFGDTKYNMSVPPEELCIIVELVTTQKARSVLISGKDGKETKNSEGNRVVNFINGKKDGTTGYGNFLTTSYTDLGTENIIEEALGITNIQVEFNSSYAPMVNIDFVDVRGGAIFQSGAKSIYNVLFRLPYPLFELKIKGFYGKPVVYCLHMVKCNTRFNSQTGNFEISASFVGYTYAMFADMILGYLRAAVRTERGKELLATKDTISINQFMKDMNNIDELVNKQLENTSNVNRNNVALANELQSDLTVIESLVDSFIADVKDPNVSEATAGDVPEPYNTSVVFLAGQTQPKAEKINADFVKEYITKRNAYNTKTGDLVEAKLKETTIIVGWCPTKVNDLIGPNGGASNKTLTDTIKVGYGDLIENTNSEVIDGVVKRQQNAAPKTLSPSEAYVKIYDVTDTRKFIQNARTELTKSQKTFTDSLALDIADAIEKKLTFEPNIRNIFKMFTAHIEIFLELMFEVSSKYLEKTRIDELKKFRQGTTNRLDIKNTADAVIYPWPEYIEKDEEKYLGAAGVLEIPLNVPEIKFVEDLYTQMVKNAEEDEETQANENGVVSWQAFNPIDSIRSIPTSPYDRLPDSATQNDVARLIVLRANGLLGVSNNNVEDTEIELFAKSEAELIIKKYKNDKIILPALTTNYNTVDKYAAVKGTVNSTEKNLLEAATYSNIEYWNYKYIEIPFNNPNFNRYEIPADKGFNNITDPYYSNYSDFKLSNRSDGTIYSDVAENADTAKYINFIDANDYESGNAQSPITSGPSIFKYDGLAKDLKTQEMVEAGFSLSNGKYGVQDFTAIDYSSKSEYGTSGNLSFYSLFYDNPLIEDGYDGELPGLSSKRIEEIGNLSRDLTFSGGNFGAYSFNVKNDFYFEKANETWKNHQDVAKNITLFGNETTQDQVCFPYLNFGILRSDAQYSISLFGSQLYNAQYSYSGRTFLFLHSLPWRGLMGKSATDVSGLKAQIDAGIFKQKELLNTFGKRTGYIQAPKLWVAFIGALLWRFDYVFKGGQEPINFDINGTILVPISNTNTLLKPTELPSVSQYLKFIPTEATFSRAKVNNPISGTFGNLKAIDLAQMNFPMCFSDYESVNYLDIDPEILHLPPPAKKYFIDEFAKFVEEFENDHSKILELNTGGGNNAWFNTWTSINNSTIIETSNDALIKHGAKATQSWIATNTLANLNSLLTGPTPGKLEDDYAMITYDYYNPVAKTVNGVVVEKTNEINNYNLYIEYKQNGKVDNKLKELFFTKQYIENDSYIMWVYGTQNVNPLIAIPKTQFAKYIDTINQALKTKVADDQKTIVSPGENEKVKLEIYRTCKKIYDKWVAGVGGSPRPFNDILFQCCSKGTNQPYRLSGDTAVNAELGTKTPNALNLIDSFRFVTRSFEDISRQFQIHPVMVTHQLYESPDSSIYDLFGRILTDNNFEFIALPNFINFNDPKELHAVFEPYPYYMAQKQTATGPSFVCVYVGQTSTKLDFGKDSEYPNDSFDITDDKTWPADFSEEKASWEDFASAFVVRYGQQNQNIFKDIRLDQSEFNETAESLSITDSISNSLSSANQSYVGQNLYNVYSVRSYKAEVEMMGDAMIQPMMYFQLDNIPMFHGAYLITKVTHSIVPNNMTTVFTGTRIRIAKTPLIDKATLYSSLISGQKIGAAKAGSTVSTSGGANGGNGISVFDRLNSKKNYSKLITQAQFEANQKAVFNNLKNRGLTREQVAGVMGNMEAESGFVTENGGADVVSESWGLIQWNLAANGFKTKEELFAAIGRDADSQTNSLFKLPAGGKPNQATTDMPKFLINSKASKTPDNAAFLFARYVEKCAGCVVDTDCDKKTLQPEYAYYNGICKLYRGKRTQIYQYKRSQYANDFYFRFNDPNDALYWGSVITITEQPRGLDTIIIGDSLAPCIESQVIKKKGRARRISATAGEASLWQGGKGVSWLLDALKKYPVSSDVKNVIITIGSNGGFNTGDNQAGLMTELKKVFPSAKYIFITGSYGWGGNVNITEAKVKTYYDVFATAGATIIKGQGYSATDAIAHSCDPAQIPNLIPMVDEILKIEGQTPVNSNTVINDSGESGNGSQSNYPPTKLTSTANFKMSQFDCSDGTKVPNQYTGNVYKVMEQLEIIRAAAGTNIRINSGYRTKSKNTSVGGKRDSQHLLGKATDITANGKTPKQLHDLILKLINDKKILQGGLGLYSTFVHYDIRGTAARWNG